MTNTQIVMKLIGPITPVGETHTDNERFENLKDLCELVSELNLKIKEVAEERTRQEYSIKRAGEYANNFLSHK